MPKVAIITVWITEFSPVMGYATGQGTLGFAFYPDDKPAKMSDG